MSRLEQLILKLAKKKMMLEEGKEEDGGCDTDSSSGSDGDDDAADCGTSTATAGIGGAANNTTATTATASSSVYGSRQYWEERYLDGVVGHSEEKGVLSNEWYLTYNALAAHLNAHIQKADSVLMLGCGLSTLGADMEADGFSGIVCIDYSETCIQRMAASAAEASLSVQYQVMDVTALEFESGTFDCVMDKATLDSLMNEDEAAHEVHQMLRESCRVLKPGGRYLCLSHSDRRAVLTQHSLGWRLHAEVPLAKNKATFWLYVLIREEC